MVMQTPRLHISQNLYYSQALLPVKSSVYLYLSLKFQIKPFTNPALSKTDFYLQSLKEIF